MGKKIDGFVLSILAAAAFYFYFQSAFGNRLFAIALALVCFAVLRRIWGRLAQLLRRAQPLKKRRLRREAAGTLMDLACMDAAQAREKLGRLLKASYRQQQPFELIQSHPSDALRTSDLFSLWRDHRGEDRLVILTTGKSDPDIRMIAASLRAPRVALLDGSSLAQLIAEHPAEFRRSAEEPAPRRKPDLRRVARLLLNRRNAPRCLLLAASMLGMYLLGASWLYLLFAALLALTALFSLRAPVRPAKLF